MNGEAPLDLIIANKTRNFFMNICDPNDPVPVTVDGHMLNVWRGRREGLVGLRFPRNLYEGVAEDIRKVAHEREVLPCQAQGIIWITWRRIHGILTTKQTELWDADMLATRLGFHPTF